MSDGTWPQIYDEFGALSDEAMTAARWPEPFDWQDLDRYDWQEDPPF